MRSPLACSAACLLLCLSLAAPSLAGTRDYAVVVHPDNPLEDISLKELQKVFKAEKQHWADKSPIYLVLPKSDQREHGLLLDKVFEMTDKELARHWIELIYRNKLAERPKQFPSIALMLRIVERKRSAIAVVDASSLTEESRVKVLTLDGKRPGAKAYGLRESSDGEREPSLEERGDDASSSPRSAALRSGEDERLDRLEQELAELQLGLLSDELGDGFPAAPRLRLSGFGHTGASVDDQENRQSGHDARFANGGLDLFLNSQLSERLSFLNETLFESGPEGESRVDVERLVIRYELDDSFSLQAGRFHTSLGYWNEAFHHGEWLQDSIGRPAVLSFEDDDGILPTHSIGVRASGLLAVEGCDLDYSLGIANGRGPTPEAIQVTSDANDHKSINASLALLPAALPGLRLGAGYYLDRIPPNADADTGSLHGELDEAIASAFAVYVHEGWEVMAEYFSIEHDGRAADTSSSGYYLQLAHEQEEWTPYLRVEATHLDDQDAYFASLEDRRSLFAGIRWDFARWSAFKLQLGHSDVDPAGGADRDEDTLAFQWSFAF